MTPEQLVERLEQLGIKELKFDCEADAPLMYFRGMLFANDQPESDLRVFRFTTMPASYQYHAVPIRYRPETDDWSWSNPESLVLSVDKNPFVLIRSELTRQKAEFEWNANRYQDNVEDSRAALWIVENELEPNPHPVQAVKPFCILDNCSDKPWDSFLDESNECYIHLTSVIPRELFLKIYTRVEELSDGSILRIRTSGSIEYGGQKLLTLVKENGYFEFAIEDFQSEPQLEALPAIKTTLESWAVTCYEPEYQDPEVTIGEMREAREEWYEICEKLKIDLDC